MSYQFLRVELFSRKGKSGRGTSFLFDEVERRPSASLHVPEPGEPVVVYGMDVPALRALHDTRADAARATTKAGKTRAVRSDQNTVAGVVLSYPTSMTEYRESADVRRDFERWEVRSVAWLREQYGDRLACVVRHEDESYPHLHAYVLPDVADAEMRASVLHPGFRAKSAVKDAGTQPGEDEKALNKRADAAYKAAMRSWLDDYHVKVSQPCGLTRLGPGKRRLTRAEWQAEKSQARALRTALDRASVVKSKVESFVQARRDETKSLVGTAETTAAALKAEADAAKADAARRLAEAAKATETAKAHADAAVREQRKARSMMSLVREETAKVRAASARLQRLPTMLRTMIDGFRVSKVAARVRAAVADEMERLREQALSAERRADAAYKQASAAEAARQKADDKVRTFDAALTETQAQRDAARREVQRLRPPEPTPAVSLGPGFGLRPTPGRR
ncbi:hypothetical protein C3Y89_32990 [Rhizobium sp. UPM1132]|uniref:plasmid recombination protein n=1 Tax=Rhizobium ruizarguesonis TaxID=2081791 RepID=UPI001447221A|nr:plasmid recombination protein [Rhizobium ruizarguesonis]NKQ75087.1 hypothetical protein [Rhizobium ruizarguesonis]